MIEGLETAVTVACPKCHAPLPRGFLNRGELLQCPSCRARLQVEAFPALFRALEKGKAGEALALDQEASCFYHPDKRATVACQACGRFLCALCDLPLNDGHLCPNCLEVGKAKGKLDTLETHRKLYGEMALNLAVWPVIIFPFWFFTCLSAPAALYLCIRHWNSPPSLVRRSRLRMWVALVLSILEISAWVFGILFLVVKG